VSRPVSTLRESILVEALLSGLAGDAEAAGNGGPGVAVGAGSGEGCGELLVGFSAAACPACGVFPRVSPKAFAKMWNDLIDVDPTHQILSAWIAKEELRVLLPTAKTGAVQSHVAHRLTRFYAWCAGSNIAEQTRLAGTIDAWWPQIEAFLQTGVTNAATEGTHHLIKDAARVAFGFRNLDNQRRRVRIACTRRQRLATAA